MDVATFLRFPTDGGASSRMSSVSGADVRGPRHAQKGGMERDAAARKRETEDVQSLMAR